MVKYEKKRSIDSYSDEESTENSKKMEMHEVKKGDEKNKKPKSVWDVSYENDDDDDHVEWSNLSTNQKIKSVVINSVKVVVVIGCLYVFICSISMLGDAFQVLSGKSAGEIFSNDSFLSNPISGLMLGILVTVLVQSSSTSTSIIISMVASGILNVETAIPIIMGANIGTSVTNTIVALSQSIQKEQFRKSFAGATVQDIFNILSVLVLLPLEIVSGYLYYLTLEIINSFNIAQSSDAPDLLKVITDPVVKGIVQVNKTVITLVAEGIPLEANASMIKIWCKQRKETINVSEIILGNSTTVFYEMTTIYEETITVGERKCESPDDFLFANTGLSDVEAGVILLFMSLFILTSCLVLMVKLLGSLLHGSVSVVIKKVINTNFKYPFGWLSGYLAIIVGAGLTFLVQSSSVFTSTLTPLVGLGVISLKRMYPLTLGANIGTTTTSLLAALASDADRLAYALQIALVHLFFNLSGIVLWYVIPFMRKIPMRGAKGLGNITAKYRWFAVLYIIFVFFLAPGLFLALSFADFWALMSVVIVVLVTVAFIIILNILQSKKPLWLPAVLRTWEFLPVWMRSLEPYDTFMTKYLLCKCCKKNNVDDDLVSVITASSNLPFYQGFTNTAFENESPPAFTSSSRL